MSISQSTQTSGSSLRVDRGTPARRRLLAVLSTVSVLASSAAAAQVVGTAGAVNPTSRSVPPASAPRVIEIGARVVFKERIQTSAQGSVQLVFVDKTSISIGPDSDLLIDDFVYDPEGGTGRMAATLAKGAMRFVGGATSHTGGASIRTPAATLGVRGGVATVRHVVEACGDELPASGQPCTHAINHFGRTTVTDDDSTQVISRPDFGVRVNAAGAATPPTRVQPAELAAIARRLTSAPGQSGGVARRPTPATVAQAGVGAAQAALDPPSTPSLQSSAGSTPRAGAATALGQQNQVTQVLQQGVQVQATETTAREERTPEPPPPPPPPRAVPERVYALTMSSDPKLRSGVPYLPAGFVASGTFRNTEVRGYGRGGTNPDGTPNRTSRFFQTGINITGQGPAQVSTIYVMTGRADVSGASGENVFSGGFVGTTRRSSTLPAGRASGTIEATGARVQFDADYSPVRAEVTSNDIDFDDRTVRNEAAYYPSADEATRTYSFNQTAERTPVPPGVQINRPTATLTGFAAGLMRTFVAGGRPLAPSFVFEGATVANLDASASRFGATIAGVNTTPSSSDSLRDATIVFGYQGEGTSGSRGTYVDDRNFAAREARLSNAGDFITRVNGQTVTTNRALFVNAGAFGASAVGTLPLCRCEYTRWGFWSSETDREVGGQTHRDILHLGTWVAGRQTVDMPVTGTATFRGHVVASIKSNESEYVAAGGFANTVNFGTRTGAVAIAGLDGRNYSGGISYGPGGNAFAGRLTGSGPGSPSMSLLGQFYDGPRGGAHEMGGRVTINGGPSYIGAGTFAASRDGVPR